MGYSAEVRSGAATVEGGYAADTKDEEGDSRQMIDQRLRMMLTYSLNDNVSIVYHGEIDTVWGETSKGNIGGGGKLGSDGVNVETKNVYLDLKSGGTSARLGIQTIADSYQGIAFFDDMAGVNFTHKMGNTTLNLAYSKWDEGTSSNSRSNYDDSDLYVADIKQKFNDNFTVGASVYFLQDNTQEDLATAAAAAVPGVPDNPDTLANEYVAPVPAVAAGAPGSGPNARESELYYYGVNAAAKFGSFGIDGFFLMMDGENDYLNKADNDIQAYAASVKANMKLDNGDVGLRVMYFSDDDDAKDDGKWRTPTGRYDFVNDNLMQFLTDKFICNYGKERYAMADAAEAGYGLLGFVASGNHKLPADMYLNWGAGYFMALEESRDDEAVNSREGDELGYEVAVRIGKKYFEKVDVSLNASYAGYGDFYDGKAVNGDDPDDTYKTYLMVNVPF